jgi:eukaryotic-like serine/threonine-protein kinase
MPLTSGTRLGPYEIVDALGAGGMGEVYRARDTRLDRSVAIKVLPSHLAAEAEVQQRFQREARAVSSLNHPHICVLHDVGHENGIHFIVMELLEGETLAARLEKGPVAVNELLTIAAQVADALATAHRAGFVHRDLKPGNIMLARSGAKLLDFGLARETGLAASPGAGLTQSPTLSRPLTAEGTIVGTFQYMAPEQLEGKEADARTDIFALGAVIYEMATGRRAFEGSSQASLIASILKETPAPISQVVPLTPPALEHVVKRCLAKDPDDRWQSARDVMLELGWIRDAGSRAGVPSPVAARRRKTSKIAWGVAAVGVSAALVLGALLVARRPPAPEVVRFSVLPPPNHDFSTSQASSALSPDGKSFAFIAVDTVGTKRLWVRRFDARDAVALPGTEGANHVIWSPDSRTIAFFAEDKLRRITIANGAIQNLASTADGRGGAWSPLGVIVYQPTAGGPLYKVSENGGEPSPVTAIDSTANESTHRFPCFLPDGRHFLYVSLPPKGYLFDVCVGSLDSFERKVILHAGGAAVYAEPGYLIFERGEQLVAQRFDSKRLEVVGDPIPIGETSGGNGGYFGCHGASVSATGVLSHWIQDSPNTEVAILDRSGREIGKLAKPDGPVNEAVVSPKGDKIVMARWNPDATSDLWIVDTARNVPTRFTADHSENFNSVWSPDGSRVLFTSSRLGGKENLYVKGFDGRDESLFLQSGNQFTKPETWSPDGSTILYHVLTGPNGADLWKVRADGSDPQPFIASRFHEVSSAFSPDGHWVAYLSDQSGQMELYATSFPEPNRRIQISTGGVAYAFASGRSGQVVWRKDGREILYVSQDERSLMAVSVEPGDPPQFGTPHVLFRLPPTYIFVNPTPDGQRFMASLVDLGGLPAAHTVVLNWPELLKQH